MKIGIIAAVVFIFAALTLLSGIMDDGVLPASAESTMGDVTGIRQTDASDSTWGTVVNIALTPVDWIKGIVKTVTWDYSFLDNPVGEYFVWIIGAPITAAVVAGLAFLFIAILSKVLG